MVSDKNSQGRPLKSFIPQRVTSTRRVPRPTQGSPLTQAAAQTPDQKQDTHQQMDGRYSRLETLADGSPGDEMNLQRKGRALLGKIRGILDTVRRTQQPSDLSNHVVRLQPHKEPLTAELAIVKYENFVENLSLWVETRLLPNLESAPETEAPVAEVFRKEIGTHSDLLDAIRWPGADGHVLTALILRALLEMIFGTVLYNVAGDQVEMVAQMVNLMGEILKPNQEKLSARGWTVEAYRAILKAEWFEIERQKVRDMASIQLEMMLGPLVKTEIVGNFQKELSKQCVEPAMRLYEEFLTSVDKFTIELERYDGRQGDFLDAAVKDEVECHDLFQGRRVLPTAESRLDGTIRLVLVKMPALVKQGTGEEKAETMCAQKAIVASGRSSEVMRWISEGYENQGTILSGWARGVGVGDERSGS